MYRIASLLLASLVLLATCTTEESSTVSSLDTGTVDDAAVSADSDGEATPPPVLGALESLPLGEVLCVAGVPTGGERQAMGVARLQEAGVRWVRTDLPWKIVEPAQGEWHYEKLEARVGPYLDAGIQVVGLLAYGNPWATTATDSDHFYPPDDPADFGTYVAAVVTHFSGRIRHWEVWNEPNAGYRFWKPTVSGDPEAFGALLKAAVGAGRGACAACRFAFGGPFFHTQFIDGHITFLTAAQEAHSNLADSYDAMGFHPYALYPPQTAPEGEAPAFDWPLWRMAGAVQEVMATYGAGDRPLWTTEVGWPVYKDVDTDTQAAFLVRAVLHLNALDAHPVCWYNLYDGPEPEAFPPEDAFGLLTHGDPSTGVAPEPKPAFLALSQLGNRFAAHRLVRDLRIADVLPEGAYGYELARSEDARACVGGEPRGTEACERWWVLWAHPTPIAVELPGAVLQAYDLLGLEAALPTGTALTVDGRPVFLQLANP